MTKQDQPRMSTRSPPDIDLRQETMEFLRDLRDEDLELLRVSIGFARSARTMGKFGKWLLVTLVTAFLGAAAFGDAMVKFRGWFGWSGH